MIHFAAVYNKKYINLNQTGGQIAQWRAYKKLTVQGSNPDVITFVKTFACWFRKFMFNIRCIYHIELHMSLRG